MTDKPNDPTDTSAPEAPDNGHAVPGVPVKGLTVVMGGKPNVPTDEKGKAKLAVAGGLDKGDNPKPGTKAFAIAQLKALIDFVDANASDREKIAAQVKVLYPDVPKMAAGITSHLPDGPDKDAEFIAAVKSDLQAKLTTLEKEESDTGTSSPHYHAAKPLGGPQGMTVKQVAIGNGPSAWMKGACSDPSCTACADKPKVGTLVKVKPANTEKYGDRTYAGVFMGLTSMGIGYALHQDRTLAGFYVGHNPMLWVPDLGKMMFGYNTWWCKIENFADVLECKVGSDHPLFMLIAQQIGPHLMTATQPDGEPDGEPEAPAPDAPSAKDPSAPVDIKSARDKKQD